MNELFTRLAILIGLGLLVGLQRQRTDARLAGFRTFPLVTLLGALCALLGETTGAWVIPAGLVALAIITVGGNRLAARNDGAAPGVTTEVAILFMFVMGAYGMAGDLTVTIATTGVVAVLLHLKPQLHGLAERIGDRDFTAIMQFAVLALVILPILPNRTFGPLDVLNPFKIWTVVVLIVGISLVGYVAFKLVGARAGAWVSGILGGLVSSTATAVSMARLSRQAPGDIRGPAFAILLSSGIVFVRVAILLGTTAPGLLREAAMPLGVMFVALVLMAWTNLHRAGEPALAASEQRNPTELRPAIVFGLLYALVLLLVAGANEYFGRQGLYIAASIAGLTDMDAITLSVSQLAGNGGIPASMGWRLILIAAIANLAFKAAVVGSLGDRRLLGRVAAGFGIPAIVGGILIWLGPA